MRREILFKAKRKDNGKWIEGYLYRISENENPFIMLRGRHGEAYEVIPGTVCQYTGLQDKRGERIWENDIVHNFGYDEPCIVNSFRGDWIGRYAPLTAWYEFDDRKKICEDKQGLSYVNLGFYVLERNSIEVIGNIFDTPMLLMGTAYMVEDNETP